MSRVFNRWCATFNNPVETPDQFIDRIRLEERIIEIYFGVQRGKETGTLHFQAVFRTAKKIAPITARSLFPEKPHIEPMKATWEIAAAYCIDPETTITGPHEFKRKAAIELPSTEQKREVILCSGPPKIGKTRIWGIISEYLSGEKPYLVPGRAKNSAGRWIGDYKGQKVALIDEFEISDFSINNWKMLLDFFPQALPSGQGGKSILWSPELVVLLTNSPLYSSHPFLKEGSAFEFRISECTNWDSLPCPLYCKKRKLHNVYADEAEAKAAQKRQISEYDLAYKKRKQFHLSL